LFRNFIIMFSQIDEIKSRLDVAEVIGEYLELKPAGHQSFKALCPFHNEKSPSFFVSRDKQIWHCFGCSLGGDVFEFIKRIDGVEFPEALRILAKKAGVVLKREDAAASNQRTKLLAVEETAARFYEKNLREKDSEPVLEYLREKRGLRDETIKQFRFGYALESWDNLSSYLRKVGFSDKEIIEAGLGIKGQRGIYDRFRGRVMLPIANHHGQVVGFTGRVADFLPSYKKDEDKSGKYINTPETEIYHKRFILYSLDQAKVAIRKSGLGIIVEGNMDAVGLHQAGFTNTVCSGGTALTAEQFSLLARYAQKWILCFDPDAAGEEATKRAFRDCLKTDLEFYALPLPAGLDPDEAVRDNPEIFKNAEKNALPMMEYFFKLALEKFSPSTLEGKKGITKILLPAIKDISSPVEKSHFLKELSLLVNVDEKSLKEAMDKIKAAPAQNHPIVYNLSRSSGKAPPVSREEKISKELLGIIMGRSDFIKAAEQKLLPENFSNSRFAELYKEIVSYYNTAIQGADFKNDFFASFTKFLSVHHPDLAPLASEAALYYEKEFAAKLDEELEEDAVERMQVILREFTRRQIKNLRDKISKAEREKNKERVEELTQEFKILMQELKNLEEK